MIKIAINGFGRIGRLTFRKLLENKDVQVLAINDLTDTKTLNHLLKYDSTQGHFPYTTREENDQLIVDGNKIKMFSERDPEKLPWKELGINLVIECTGIFRDKEGMQKHIKAGAEKVLLSAPAKGDIKTIVLGVNDDELTSEDILVSNASCTTNCLAPMVKVLHDNFGVLKGLMTTVHAYTADQNLQDAPHSDLRRARAAAINIIPTTTGAANAVELVLPQLKGKLDGMAIRVPTPAGSITDFTVQLEKECDKEAVNNAMKTASEGDLKGILYYSTEPLVSTDIVGDSHSCIFDSELTIVKDKMVKVVGWYDNEAGYASRLADLAITMGSL